MRAPSHSSERSALLFALAGFALLSVGDAVVKSMSGQWAPTAIATLRYSLGAVGLSALLMACEGRRGFAVGRLRLQLVRGAAVAVATIAFFSALLVMPLAEATTIIFVSPIVTALLAPLFLGERSGLATWIASLVAFVGVLIVLRPSVAEIGLPALLPLASAAAMSVLVIANRAVARAASPLAMQSLVALCAVPFMLGATVLGHVSGIGELAVDWPPAIVVAKATFVAVSASTAHWLIFVATTRAGAATVAPMTYVQLIIASGLGWLLFGDRPDTLTWLGAAIIIAAGLFLWRFGPTNRT